MPTAPCLVSVLAMAEPPQAHGEARSLCNLLSGSYGRKFANSCSVLLPSFTIFLNSVEVYFPLHP